MRLRSSFHDGFESLKMNRWSALLLPLALSATPIAHARDCSADWVSAWASSQFRPTGDAELPSGTLRDQTLRQIVRPSVDGNRIRVRFSNVAGTRPLQIAGASIAPKASSRISYYVLYTADRRRYLRSLITWVQRIIGQHPWAAWRH